MRKPCYTLWSIRVMICFAGMAAYCPAKSLADNVYVTDDTYLDGRSSGNTTNFGTATGVKVFVNRTTPEPTHGLISLPPVLGTVAAGDLNSVKLWLWNSGSQSIFQPMELHPLTTSFTETGATWLTSDGTTPWTTAGGDYGENHIDVTAPVNTMWSTFDITSMMTGSDRADLLNHGVLLKMSNDTVAPANTTGQNFVSSENTTLPLFHPYFEVIAYGDFDSNHIVDAADYVLWRKNNGSATDYNIWRAHFGETIPGGGMSIQGATAVPEPCFPTLLFGAAFTLCAAMARERSRSSCVHNWRCFR
jgi:hypothetical protein